MENEKPTLAELRQRTGFNRTEFWLLISRNRLGRLGHRTSISLNTIGKLERGEYVSADKFYILLRELNARLGTNYHREDIAGVHLLSDEEEEPDKEVTRIA